MRKVSLFLIIAALIVAASSTKPAAFEPEQDRAAEVLGNVRKAIGDGKLDRLKTFSFEAKTARNQANGQLLTDVEMYLELPDKYLRVDNVTAPIARTTQMGHNADKVIRSMGGASGGQMIMNGMHVGGGGGDRVMVMMGGGGAPPPPPGAPGGGNAAPTPEQIAMMNASMIRSQRVELSRMMLGWFGMAHPGLNATYTYAGEAESPDGKAHVIDIKAEGGFAAKLFVDQASNLPLMVTYTGLEPITFSRGGGPGAPAGAPVVSSGGRGAAGAPAAAGAAAPTQGEMQKMLADRKTIEYRIFFTDWKEVDGIQFPHTIQRATAGTTTEEWTIAKVKLNPKIDAKKFATQ